MPKFAIQKGAMGLRPELAVLLGVVLTVAASAWAWQRLAQLPALHAAADAQLMQVQAMAAQARSLQALQGTASAVDAAALPAQVQQLLGSSAQLQITGDTAVLRVQNVPASQWAAGMARWQQQARVGVSGAQLSQKDGAVSGSVQLRLPGGAP